MKRRGFELWVLAGVWLLASLVIFYLATGHESPRRYQDEFLFWGVAKAFAAGDGLTWRGQGLGLFYFLYPVLLAPAFWLGDSVAANYTAIHLINSLMMTGVVFPAYLMARQFADRGPAALAALLALSAPAMNYAGIIGTECLAYPVATAAFGAMIFSIARPRRRNWLLALALIVVAVLTRAQFAVFAPVYFAALIVAGLMRETIGRRDYFRLQREPLAVLMAGFALVGIVFLIKGRSVLGIYAGVFEGVSPTFGDVVYWVKALTADVYVVSAVVPVIATFAMFVHRENRRDPLVGALLAVALLASLALIAQVAWFSAVNPYDWRTRHIFYERYMFYLGPLFFTGLVVAWKRVSIQAALISSAVAVIVMTGFQTGSVLVPFSYDSFGLTLIGHYMAAHPSAAPHIGMILAGVTALIAELYCFSRLRRSRIAHLLGVATVTLVLGILVIGQARTWRDVRTSSRYAFAVIPKPADFIDRATRENVGMIITSTDSPEMYFTTEFWNKRVVRAFATDAPPIKTPIMYSPRCTFDWAKTGEILGTGCDEVPNAFYLRSDNLSMHLKDEVKRVHPTPRFPNLTLIVGKPPARMLSLLDGRNTLSGEIEDMMTVGTFLDRPGQLRVKFAESDRALVAKTGRGGKIKIAAGRRGSLTIPLPAAETLTSVSVKSPAGVPEIATVADVLVRERGGRWISIR